MQLLLIGIGGFAGAIGRYAVDAWIGSRLPSAFPFGTLVVNLSGSLAMGILFAIAIEREVLANELRWPLMVGFVGAYTTFSTLALDSWRLAESGSTLLAAANLGGTTLLGMGAVILGLTIGRGL